MISKSKFHFVLQILRWINQRPLVIVNIELVFFSRLIHRVEIKYKIKPIHILSDHFQYSRSCELMYLLRFVLVQEASWLGVSYTQFFRTFSLLQTIATDCFSYLRSVLKSFSKRYTILFHHQDTFSVGIYEIQFALHLAQQ